MTERKPNHLRIQKDSGKRILVVDDEYDISLTIKVVLEENGFKVDSFTDASQALQNFRDGLYDLVILDVIMPEMDGFPYMRRLKNWMIRL
jgi:DNA-binding response OmpR family regulator